MALEGVIVPKDLDSKGKVLGADIETVMIAVALAVMGGILGHLGAGCAAGVAAAVFWHGMIKTHVRGYAMQLCYWHLGMPRLKRTPPSSRRRFIG